jgi:hypothetical protein
MIRKVKRWPVLPIATVHKIDPSAVLQKIGISKNKKALAAQVFHLREIIFIG